MLGYISEEFLFLSACWKHIGIFLPCSPQEPGKKTTKVGALPMTVFPWSFYLKLVPTEPLALVNYSSVFPAQVLLPKGVSA